jgi:hypothetical protein
MIILVRALAAALTLATCMAAPAAFADSRTVEGSTLVLDDTMSSDVVINVKSTLANHIVFSAHGDLSCLSVVGTGAVSVSTSGCDSSGRLAIDVPRGTPLTITAGGSGNIRFADDIAATVTLSLTGSGDLVGRGITGALVLDVHGANDVSLGNISGEATLDMAGSGDVRLAGIDGVLALKHTGSGELAVGHVESPSVTIDSTGSGDMLFGRGDIRSLVAHLQGNGDLGVAAEVHDGDIRAYGGGDVKLGRVTGSLAKANGDDSDIIVGGPRIVDTVVGEVAKKIAEDPESDSESRSTHSYSVHGLMLLVLAIAAFILWRIMRRPGGLAGLRAKVPVAPSHPGVVALCERMARMEERLGRVEGYVTSREFDLHQKFRNL